MEEHKTTPKEKGEWKTDAAVIAAILALASNSNLSGLAEAIKALSDLLRQLHELLFF